MQENRRRYLTIVVILIFAAFVFRIANNLEIPLFQDEARHIVRAQDILAGLIWQGIDQNKWLYGIVLALFNPTGPEAGFIGRVVTALFGILTLAATIKLGMMLFSRRVAYIAGLMYMFVPLTWYHEREALVDPLMVAAATISIIFAIKLAKRPKLTYAVGLALALTISRLTKAAMIAYFVLPFIAIVFYAYLDSPLNVRDWRSVWQRLKANWRTDLQRVSRQLLYAAGAVLFALAVTGLIYWLASLDGWSPKDTHAIATENIAWHLLFTRNAPVFLAKEAYKFAEVHIRYVTPTLLVLIGWTIVASFKWKDQRSILFLLFPALFFSAIPMLAARPVDGGNLIPARYFLLNAPPLMLLAGIGFWQVMGWLATLKVDIPQTVMGTGLLIIALLPGVFSYYRMMVDPQSDPLLPGGYARRYQYVIVDYLQDAYDNRGDEEMEILVGTLTSVWIRAAYGPRVANVETVRTRDWPIQDMANWLDEGKVVAAVIDCDGETCCPDRFGDFYDAHIDHGFYCFALEDE